jgi:four helix bundle protein
MIKDFKDLIVWQKAMDAVLLVYKLVKKLPKEEMYALSDQMRRAAVSIPSNIAEGQARNSDKEFAQFLAIAKGSKAELETQLLLCVTIGYLTEQDIQDVVEILQEVAKIINALQNKLTTKTNR